MTDAPEMDLIAGGVSAGLRELKIQHYIVDGGHILIPLPNHFGELEVGAIETVGLDSIVGLVGHSWHTHGDVLMAENGGEDQVSAILRLVRDIFQGRFLLIEERIPGKSPRKIIVKDLDAYLKYLPQDAIYQIYNPQG